MCAFLIASVISQHGGNRHPWARSKNDILNIHPSPLVLPPQVKGKGRRTRLIVVVFLIALFVFRFVLMFSEALPS